MCWPVLSTSRRTGRRWSGGRYGVACYLVGPVSPGCTLVSVDEVDNPHYRSCPLVEIVIIVNFAASLKETDPMGIAWRQVAPAA